MRPDSCQSEPVRIMPSPRRRRPNHLDESYLTGQTPDIWDKRPLGSSVDFANGTRAMLELCMFAEGAVSKRKFAPWPQGKIEGAVRRSGRFLAGPLGARPDPR